MGGAERRSAVVCLLSAATGGPHAAEDAGEGEPARYRRQEGSTHACEAREGLRGTCQVHCERVSEVDEHKMTLKLNFLNFEQ